MHQWLLGVILVGWNEGGGEYLGRLSEAQLEWGESGGHVHCVHEVEMDVQ